MPSAREHQAIHIARQYLEFRGYTLEDASTSSAHTGYNLIAKRNAESLRIAVRACRRPWDISDLDVTDFDVEKRLVADFLYIVCLKGREEPKLCIIPREALKPEFIVPKQGYRINAKLKKEGFLKPFLHAI